MSDETVYPLHVMQPIAQDEQAVQFACPDCPRRLVIGPEGSLRVIEQGDFFALHSGGAVVVDVGVGDG